MKINGSAVSWKAVAIAFGTVLYALVVWLAGSTLAEVKAIRKDMGDVQRKNSVQDQRIRTLEAWTFPPYRPPSTPPTGPGNG